MKALVTGGGGFLGRYIVEQLQARGDSVRVFSRGDYPELRSSGVELQRGDIRNADDVRKACAGVDVVFHVAAIPGVWGPWKTYHDINTLGTQNVLAGCRAEGVRKLVYTSSPSVVFDGQPHLNATESLPYPENYLCHYPHTKAIAEREVLATHDDNGLLTCAIRPHLIWGPRDNHLIPRLLQKARSGRLRRVGDGSNLISMSYVENSAAGHIQAADRLEAGSPVGGQAYFLNEPEPVNLWSWINEILALAGQSPITRSISAGTAYRVGSAMESVFRLLRLPGEPPMTRFLALQLSQSHTYSVAKAEQDFGYAPAIDYNTAMQRLAADLPRMLK